MKIKQSPIKSKNQELNKVSFQTIIWILVIILMLIVLTSLLIILIFQRRAIIKARQRVDGFRQPRSMHLNSRYDYDDSFSEVTEAVELEHLK